MKQVSSKYSNLYLSQINSKKNIAFTSSPNETKEANTQNKTFLIGALSVLAVGGIYIATKGKGNKVVKEAIADNKPVQELKKNLLALPEKTEQQSWTIDAFKNAGNKLEKGKAFTAEGKNFTGELITDKNGITTVIKYKDGLITESIQRKGDEVLFVKHYNGNLNCLTNSSVIVHRGNEPSKYFSKDIKKEVQEGQAALKELLENNEKLSSENFRKEANKIKYKTKKQKEEIEKVAVIKEFFEDEKKRLDSAKNSTYRNERWLEEQHDIKQKEYNEWWQKALEEREQPFMERKRKENEKIKQIIEQEKAKFFEENKDKLPPPAERFNDVWKYCRTEYGNTFQTAVEVAKRQADVYRYDDNMYLEYLWARTPRAMELDLKSILNELNPDQLDLYNRAVKVLKDRNISFNGYELALDAKVDSEVIRSIAKEQFAGKYGDLVLGHAYAYSINGALRAGAEVDDLLRVTLDEGFRVVTPLESELTTYRHAVGGKSDGSIDFINQLIKSKKGDTFIDKGYSYSSTCKGGAYSCNGIQDPGSPEVKMIIKNRKGARISDGTSYEQSEILYPRLSEFKLLEDPKIIPRMMEDYKICDVVEVVVEFLGSKLYK